MDLKLFRVLLGLPGRNGGASRLSQLVAARDSEHAKRRVLKHFGGMVCLGVEQPNAEEVRDLTKEERQRVRLEIKVLEAVHTFELETGRRVKSIGIDRSGVGRIVARLL